VRRFAEVSEEWKKIQKFYTRDTGLPANSCVVATSQVLRRSSLPPQNCGGTNPALPGRVPPTQFCDRRNSPGILLAPRATRWGEFRVRAGERDEAAGDPTNAMLHRGEAVRNFLDIVNRNAGFCVIFSPSGQEFFRPVVL